MAPMHEIVGMRCIGSSRLEARAAVGGATVTTENASAITSGRHRIVQV